MLTSLQLQDYISSKKLMEQPLLSSNLWNMEHLGIPRLLNHGLIFHSCLTLCSLWNMEHFPWEPFSTFQFSLF